MQSFDHYLDFFNLFLLTYFLFTLLSCLQADDHIHIYWSTFNSLSVVFVPSILFLPFIFVIQQKGRNLNGLLWSVVNRLYESIKGTSFIYLFFDL